MSRWVAIYGTSLLLIVPACAAKLKTPPPLIGSGPPAPAKTAAPHVPDKAAPEQVDAVVRPLRERPHAPSAAEPAPTDSAGALPTPRGTSGWTSTVRTEPNPSATRGDSTTTSQVVQTSGTSKRRPVALATAIAAGLIAAILVLPRLFSAT